MSNALVIEDVTKSYEGHTAVRALSLSVPTGSIYGILGPNGAGKSTTLRMVMNIIGRDAGRISLLGSDPARDRRVLERVGYLPEERGLYRKMKVIDVIVFFGRLKGLTESTARSEGEAWLERMGLADWRDARVETLSKGMQQKVQFIATVVHEPELLILDEPHSGLDPVNQEVLRDTILNAARRGRTVIFSTHNMDQAEQLCDSICIIARGEKVLDGGVKAVRKRHRGNRYRIEFDGPASIAHRFLERNHRFVAVEPWRDGWEVELTGSADPQELLSALGAVGVPLVRFERVSPSLHEIFVAHVTDATSPAHGPEAIDVQA